MERESNTNTTIGHYRVRSGFNPSGNPLVDDIKRTTARLIDLCESMKGKVVDTRCCSLAQTAYEEAAMWAVKAATSGDANQTEAISGPDRT